MAAVTLNAHECIYCGDLATDRDHVIPFALTEKTTKTFTSSEVVPACKDCNGALHAKPLFSISARAEWLAKRLKKKQILQSPDWAEADIKTLGPTLRQYVRRQALLKKAAVDRLQHMEQVAQMRQLTPAEYWNNA